MRRGQRFSAWVVLISFYFQTMAWAVPPRREEVSSHIPYLHLRGEEGRLRVVEDGRSKLGRVSSWSSSGTSSDSGLSEDSEPDEGSEGEASLPSSPPLSPRSFTTQESLESLEDALAFEDPLPFNLAGYGFSWKNGVLRVEGGAEAPLLHLVLEGIPQVVLGETRLATLWTDAPKLTFAGQNLLENGTFHGGKARLAPEARLSYTHLALEKDASFVARGEVRGQEGGGVTLSPEAQLVNHHLWGLLGPQRWTGQGALINRGRFEAQAPWQVEGLRLTNHQDMDVSQITGCLAQLTNEGTLKIQHADLQVGSP